MSLNPNIFNGLLTSLFCSDCKVKTRIEYQTIRSNNNRTYFAIVKCIDCNKLTFLHYGDVHRNDKETRFAMVAGGRIPVELIFSFPNQSETKVEDIPKKIAASYLEGVRCLDANAPNGAVGMFRRALQQICVEGGANPRDRLTDQLKILPADAKPTAIEIKEWGNLGVHEDSDGIITEITISQAESIKTFLERVFMVAYQHPAALRKSQNARKGK